MIEADVRDPAALAAMFAKTLEQFGRVISW